MDARWQDNDSVTSNSMVPFNCFESISDHFVKGKQITFLLARDLGKYMEKRLQ